MEDFFRFLYSSASTVRYRRVNYGHEEWETPGEGGISINLIIDTGEIAAVTLVTLNKCIA